MEEKIKLCKNCKRFIVDKENKKSICEMKHFDKIDFFKSYIYVPEMFDCEDWLHANARSSFKSSI